MNSCCRYVQKASLPHVAAVQGVSSLSDDSKTAHHSPASEQTSKLKLSCTEKCPFTQVWTHTHTHTHTPSHTFPTQPTASSRPPSRRGFSLLRPKAPRLRRRTGGAHAEHRLVAHAAPWCGEDAERTRGGRGGRGVTEKPGEEQKEEAGEGNTRRVGTNSIFFGVVVVSWSHW